MLNDVDTLLLAMPEFGTTNRFNNAIKLKPAGDPTLIRWSMSGGIELLSS
jgi:hypothetical protein